ncbi:MAG TPA: ATP-binding protein, partial [Vicinamibacteria bacterium]
PGPAFADDSSGFLDLAGVSLFLASAALLVLAIPRWIVELAQRTRARQRELRKLGQELEQKTRALDEASAALEAAQRDLVKAEGAAVLGRLVPGLIHELSSPLGVIRTGADLSENAVTKLEMSSDPPPKRITEALLGAHRASLAATERLSAILESLRNVSRLDRDRVEVADVHQGLEDALTLLAPRLHEGIAVRRKLGEIPRILCRPAELNHVFLHVLLNAVQAIESSGTITIETSCEGNVVSVRVTDDGRGIDSAVMELLFLPAFRRTGTEAKAGMGLFLSHQIVEKHGGRMLVASESGRGTSVTIKLPRDRSLGVA